ncbi:MAG: hypothetical protein C4519_08645 [Desulfobacteraceae bacterium]|nr:MAG: hypothetical protein C4519_08645 [Desulfobacteraceae bacterium]
MRNQEGSALLIAVLVMVAITIIGVIAIQTSSTELSIAAHDKWHKMTFFGTDGVTSEITPELIEQAIEERGFGDTTPVAYGPSGDLQVHVSDFYLNEEGTCEANIPSPTNRDVEIANQGETSVYLRIYGDTEFSPGNALQLPEGYHGRGKGAAGGGAIIIYNVRGLGIGANETKARISTRYMHVI